MKQQLIKLIKENALEYGDFVLSSGIKSDYFIDLSKVTNTSNGLSIISKLIFNEFWYSIDAIGGPVLGAAPLIGGVLFYWNHYYEWETKKLRGFLVRKQEEKGTFIEGSLKEGDHVVILEDVVTTGQSVFKAIKHVENYGGIVVGIVAVLDRLIGAKYFLEEMQGYKFTSLLTIEDLL